MNEFIQVLTTTDHPERAETIATELLQRKLAACVQIGGPIASRYWWKGRLETAQEWVCVIKTRRSLYADIERQIRSIHPYETPEIIALPIVDGSRQYLSWIADSTARGPQSASASGQSEADERGDRMG